MGLIGKKIGPYVVQAELGAGGMAVVYRAEQPMLQRLVAIKALRSDLGRDKAVLTRFAREAKYVAALAHQNIVHIYDYLARAQTSYIVMEYVDGIDVFGLLHRGGRMPPDVAAAVACQAARALAYAHQRGVVHRDFKPSNLMLTRQGDVKLMDFGIARDASYDDVSLTRPGIALGTPAYMSPEQILGERVDFRSDLFAFGIVLYQMLTGDKPFADDDTRSVMNHILHAGYRPPRACFPDIPWALQRIVQRCLRKRPQDRYPSTEALRHDLERLLLQRLPQGTHARLVLYLHHQQVVDVGQATTTLGRRALAADGLREVDAGRVDGTAAVLLPSLAACLAALLVVAAWTVWVAWAEVGLGLGRLEVTVRPWAEVLVDGQSMGTTPVPGPLRLRPGGHVVELRNRFLQGQILHVEVAAGRTRRLDVELTRPRAGPPGAAQ